MSRTKPNEDEGFTTVTSPRHKMSRTTSTSSQSSFRSNMSVDSSNRNNSNNNYHNNNRNKGRNAPNRSKSMESTATPNPRNKTSIQPNSGARSYISSNSSVGSSQSRSSVHSRNQRPIRANHDNRSPKSTGSSRSGISNNYRSSNSSNGNNNRKAPDRSQSSSAVISGSNQWKQHQNSNNNNNRHVREVILYNTTGSGNTRKERQVIRWSAEALLAKRMMYLEAPPVRTITTTADDREMDDRDDNNHRQQHPNMPYITKFWMPHPRCEWISETRIEMIEQEMTKYLDYKPLQVNDETRWKPKVIKRAMNEDEIAAHDEIIKSSILSILNKLSWTNLDKLTFQFLKALGTSAAASNQYHPHDHSNDANSQSSERSATSIHTVALVMRLVVEKAMLEPHFAELYANLSVKLAHVHKAFKRSLLTICQEQFDVTERNESNKNHQQSLDSISENTNSTSIRINKQASIGLMKFIGELYTLGIIKGAIMISCLNRLLVPDDEEKLECFSKLMTTIGSRLHEEKSVQHAEQMKSIWDLVYILAGKKQQQVMDDNNNNGPILAPSIRLKFILQSLIELKENGWIQIRHQVEKAKTIQEIHQDIAAEELEKARMGGNLLRNRSYGSTATFNNNFNNSNNNKKPLKRSVSSDGCMYPSSSVSSDIPLSRQDSTISNTSSDNSSSFYIEQHNHDVLSRSPKPRRVRRAKSDSAPKQQQPQQQQQVNNSNDESSRSKFFKNTATSPNNNNFNSKNNPEATANKQNLTNPQKNNNDNDNGSHKNDPPNLPKLTNNVLDLTHIDNNNNNNSVGQQQKKFGSSSNLSVSTPNNDFRLSPKECGERSKTIFKEYFISDDKKETIMSIQELLGTNCYDSSNNIDMKLYYDSCVAMIESCILMVLEMKERDVYKFLEIIAACINQEIIIIIENISTSSNNILIRSLNDPLEFLRDIEIDAPMASSYLSLIIATWIDCKYILSIGFLLFHVPEYFKTDGRPAEFAIHILYKLHVIQTKKKNDISKQHQLDLIDDESPINSNHNNADQKDTTDITINNNENATNVAVVRHEQEFKIIENLMTENDKKLHPAVHDFVTAMLAKFTQS